MDKESFLEKADLKASTVLEVEEENFNEFSSVINAEILFPVIRKTLSTIVYLFLKEVH